MAEKPVVLNLASPVTHGLCHLGEGHLTCEEICEKRMHSANMLLARQHDSIPFITVVSQMTELCFVLRLVELLEAEQEVHPLLFL